MGSPQTNTSLNHQRGTGLVEVLVALVLLAVAALGYAALQTRALGTTDEAIMRTSAQTLLQELAERMRANNLADEVLMQYQTQLTDSTPPSLIDCTFRTDCTSEDTVNNDVAVLRTQAKDQGILLGMVICPGTSAAAKTMCLIGAWNETTASMSNTSNDCMDGSGVYRLYADCVYMEAY